MTRPEVFCMDWLENDLPDKSVDLIIADPPYFRVKGDFDFGFESFESYLKLVENWAVECRRILKDNGTLFWDGDSLKIAYSQIILDKYFNLENALVWNKGSFLGLQYSEDLRKFAPCTERLLMYSNDVLNLKETLMVTRDYLRSEVLKSKGRINFTEINKIFGTATNGGGVSNTYLSTLKSSPSMITKEHYTKLKEWCAPYFKKTYQEIRDDYESAREIYEKTRRPFNNFLNLQEVLNFSNEAIQVGAKYDHDTVKPETLTRALIKTTTNPGDVLVVPFAGSGTEVAMGVREGLVVFGYEINKKHSDMTTKRALKIFNTPQLF